MQAFHLLEVFEGFAIVSGVRLMLIVAVVFSFAHITMVFMVLMVLLVCRVVVFFDDFGNLAGCAGSMVLTVPERSYDFSLLIT